METVQCLQRITTAARVPGIPEAYPLFDEERFRSLLILEREKAELCKRKVLLVQIDVSGFNAFECREKMMLLILSGIFTMTREKDLKGWLNLGRLIGIIFPHLDGRTAGIVANKIKTAMGELVSAGRSPAVPVSCTIFPASEKSP